MAYQVVNRSDSRKSLVYTRVTHRQTDRQTDRQKSDLNSGAFRSLIMAANRLKAI